MKANQVSRAEQQEQAQEIQETSRGARRFGLLVPSDLRCLDNLRNMVSDLAEAVGFSRNEIGRIEVAVDEACTNAIEHAYRDVKVKPPIQIDVFADDERLVIDVIDSGSGFDFKQERLPKFPDHWFHGNVRGAGLYLISECMDEVSYERMSDNRNRMRLIKNKNGSRREREP